MNTSQVTVRRTPSPSVLEIEVIQPRDGVRAIPLDGLLSRHRIRSLYSCIVDTKRHARLYAKLVRHDGEPFEAALMGSLLDALRSAVMTDANARAA